MATLQFYDVTDPALSGISLDSFLNTGGMITPSDDGAKYVWRDETGRRIEVDYHIDEYFQRHTTHVTYIATDAQGEDVVVATVSGLDFLGITRELAFLLDGIDTIIGSAGGDQLTAYHDLTSPYSSSDLLRGEGGDDVLTSNFGNCILDGGTGNDTIRLSAPGGSPSSAYTQVAVAGGEGIDTLEIVWGGTYTFKAIGDYQAISGVERLVFASGSSALVRFTTDQVATLPTNFAVENLGPGRSFEIVRTPGEAAVFDLSGWTFTFTGWTEEQILHAMPFNFKLAESGASFDDRIIGSRFRDWINTGGGADLIDGGSGDDLLVGGAGADTVRGGAGDDVIVFSEGDGAAGEILDGGEGFDILNCSGDLRGATISGIEQILVSGTAYFNTSVGPNAVFKKSGSMPTEVQIHLGEVSELDTSNWLLENWSNDDRLAIIGSAGANRIIAPTFRATIDGGDGIDIVRFDRSQQTTSVVFDFGTPGPEERTLQDGSVVKNIERFDLIGGSARDILVGGSYDDTLAGGAAVDMLEGGEGNDSLDGGSGADFMNGGLGDDTYVISDEDVVIDSGGTDTFLVSDSFSLSSFAQIENLAVQTASSTHAVNLTGNALANALTGNAGANVLAGLDGNDIIRGLGGDDRLYGGLGSDTLEGGAGLDFFEFDTKLNALTNVDIIVDFNADDDTIRLENAVFRGLKAGALSKGAFVSGRKAADSYDRIIYDKNTGSLYYDPDGSGRAKQVLFAKLMDKAALSYRDFLVI